jgi:hypothetical protein
VEYPLGKVRGEFIYRIQVGVTSAAVVLSLWMSSPCGCVDCCFAQTNKNMIERLRKICVYDVHAAHGKPCCPRMTTWGRWVSVTCLSKSNCDRKLKLKLRRWHVETLRWSSLQAPHGQCDHAFPIDKSSSRRDLVPSIQDKNRKKVAYPGLAVDPWTGFLWFP